MYMFYIITYCWIRTSHSHCRFTSDHIEAVNIHVWFRTSKLQMLLVGSTLCKDDNGHMKTKHISQRSFSNLTHALCFNKTVLFTNMFWCSYNQVHVKLKINTKKDAWWSRKLWRGFDVSEQLQPLKHSFIFIIDYTVIATIIPDYGS